ncbi:MAG: hypothetical protein ACE5FA_05080 [Dehalococcoidia bacterium]
MLIQRVNRSDAERVFIAVKNSYSTAAITVGQAVCFDYTTDADGVGVTQPTTALLTMPAGIVEDASIAAGEYGLVQIYGHNANALVNGSSGTDVGDPLIMQNGAFDIILATEVTNGDAVSYFFVAGEAYSTGAAAAKKVFIRCM